MKRIAVHTFVGLIVSASALSPWRTLAAAPVVNNASGATNVLSISATLTGTLASTGGLPTQVRAYWGEADGGATFVSWSHTNGLGTNAVGPLSIAVTNLVPNRVYFYRFYATNLNGSAWASTTTNFQTRAASGPLSVVLGETAHFTILAGTTVTYPGSGTVHGDVGLSPGTGAAILIPKSQVVGTIYAVDAGYSLGASVIDSTLLSTAKGDLTVAYDYARDLTPVPTGTFLNPGAGNIGGLNLVPGIYKFTGEAHLSGADVTLTGGPDDVWIFQIATALIVEPGVNRSVILAGGARAKNIFWQVGTSATLGTYSVFKGTIMADASITMDVGCALEGRALAFSGQVVFNGSGSSLPSHTLTILSAHGTGTPPVGTYSNGYGRTLTNRVTGAETLGGTQYVSSGWVLAGAADTNRQVSGTGTNMVMSLTNDTVLTWLWKTNYLLTASAGTNGIVTGSTNGWYAAGSNVTVTATPNFGYHFSGWMGDVPAIDTVNPNPTLTMSQSRTILATFATTLGLPEVLTVVSAHGIGLPPAGSYTNTDGTVLTNRMVGMVSAGGTQYVSTGWALAGGVGTNGMSFGAGTNATLSLTNIETLTWLWSTNYLLNAFSADTNGIVTGSTNGWYVAGTDVTLMTTPNPGYHFTSWTGDVPAVDIANPNPTVTMSQARTMLAHFALSLGLPEVLTIVSAHGIGLPMVGVYTNLDGTVLNNRMSGVDTQGGTQYVCIGWSLTGNLPFGGSATNFVMTQTNNATLTWLWATNYLLDLTVSPTNCAITNEISRFIQAGTYCKPLFPQASYGYVFDHWKIDGVDAGSVWPTNVLMAAPAQVEAVFAPIFVQVNTNVFVVTWQYYPPRSTFFGTLVLTNTTTKIMAAPFWYEVKSSPDHWLRYPSGIDSNTTYMYLDLSAQFTQQVALVGNHDQYLDPGESITIGGTNIELCGRVSPPPESFIQAIWVDPTASAHQIITDSDHDGIPDAVEALYPTLLNPLNPNDAKSVDGSGMTILAKYIAGLDLADPHAAFTVRFAEDGSHQLTWQGAAGRVYKVWCSTNLAAGFFVAQDGIQGIAGPMVYTNVDSAAQGTFFYRLEVRLDE